MSEMINETVDVTTPTVKIVNEIPTRDDVKARGWSQSEIESAEKRGMIAPTKKTADESAKTVKEDKVADVKEVNEVEKVVESTDEKKPASLVEKATDKKIGGIPNYDLTEEQQQVLKDILPPGNPVRGIYFRMKNERALRQKLEDQLAKERAIRAEYEEKLNGLVSAKSNVAEASTESDEDKPLTIRALRELEAKNAEEAERRAREVNSRAVAVSEAQRAQEEYAREIFPDFDETVTRAKDVIQNIEKITEPWKKAKAKKLFQELVATAAEADNIGIDEYNAAMIAYEIGKLHQDYGKKSDEQTNGNALRPEPKANGGLTPDKMKRMEENSQRRASSASLSGGNGRRLVLPDEVSLEDLNRMTANQRLSFRDKHPEQYARLLRG